MIRNCLTVYTSIIYLHFIQLRITYFLKKMVYKFWVMVG